MGWRNGWYECTVNANECLMTRMQEMSLDYHFKVEQEVGSSTHAFFGFNGKLLLSFYGVLSPFSPHYFHVPYAWHNSGTVTAILNY